jgi:hypothetical protein
MPPNINDDKSAKLLLLLLLQECTCATTVASTGKSFVMPIMKGKGLRK